MTIWHTFLCIRSNFQRYFFTSNTFDTLHITCNDNIFHFFLQGYVLFLKSLLSWDTIFACLLRCLYSPLQKLSTSCDIVEVTQQKWLNMYSILKSKMFAINMNIFFILLALLPFSVEGCKTSMEKKPGKEYYIAVWR